MAIAIVFEYHIQQPFNNRQEKRKMTRIGPFSIMGWEFRYFIKYKDKISLPTLISKVQIVVPSDVSWSIDFHAIYPNLYFLFFIFYFILDKNSTLT